MLALIDQLSNWFVNLEVEANVLILGVIDKVHSHHQHCSKDMQTIHVCLFTCYLISYYTEAAPCLLIMQCIDYAVCVNWPQISILLRHESCRILISTLGVQQPSPLVLDVHTGSSGSLSTVCMDHRWDKTTPVCRKHNNNLLLLHKPGNPAATQTLQSDGKHQIFQGESDQLASASSPGANLLCQHFSQLIDACACHFRFSK